MQGFGLESHEDVTWELRLRTIGRMLDQQPAPVPTMHITVLEQGIVLQRPTPLDQAFDRLRSHGERSAVIARPLPLDAVAVNDDPFLVKRVAAAAPARVRSSVLPATIRERLRGLMRAARGDAPCWPAVPS